MNNSKRQFTEIENSTEEIRSIIYDVFATYNIILQDHRRFSAFDIIQQEYNYLNLPILNDKDFGLKLKSELEQSLNVSFSDVIKACEHNQIFMDLITFLER